MKYTVFSSLSVVLYANVDSSTCSFLLTDLNPVSESPPSFQEQPSTDAILNPFVLGLRHGQINEPRNSGLKNP